MSNKKEVFLVKVFMDFSNKFEDVHVFTSEAAAEAWIKTSAYHDDEVDIVKLPLD